MLMLSKIIPATGSPRPPSLEQYLPWQDIFQDWKLPILLISGLTSESRSNLDPTLKVIYFSPLLLTPGS